MLIIPEFGWNRQIKYINKESGSLLKIWSNLIKNCFRILNPKLIVNAWDAHIYFSIYDIYKTAEHNDEVKNIPCITKIILEKTIF